MGCHCSVRVGRSRPGGQCRRREPTIFCATAGQQVQAEFHWSRVPRPPACSAIHAPPASITPSIWARPWQTVAALGQLRSRAGSFTHQRFTTLRTTPYLGRRVSQAAISGWVWSTDSKRNRRSSAAIPRTASIRARCCPTHIRGPAPNGK